MTGMKPLWSFVHNAPAATGGSEVGMDKDRGSITVFLAVIFMAMLIFTGSLADAARIMVAGRKVEAALSTSARSVLAGYDAGLVGEFGLFGLDERSDMKKELLHYLNLNLEERQQGIRFIRYDLQQDKVAVEGFGSLADRDILKHQILEYMKYRAPIGITQGIIGQLKKARLGQKTEFASKEKNVRGKAGKLEEEIDALNKEVDAANEIMEALPEDRLKELQDRLKRILEVYIPEIKELYASYLAAREESDDFLDRKDPEDNLSNREAGINGNESLEFETVWNDCEIIKAEAADCRKKVDEAVVRITPIRKQINTLQGQISSLERSIRAMEKKSPPPDELIEEYRNRIEELQEQVEDKEQQIEDILEALERSLNGEYIQKVNINSDDGEGPRHSEDDKENFIGRLEEIRAAFDKLSVYIGQDMLISGDEFAHVVAKDYKYLEEMRKSLELDDRSGNKECEAGFDKIYEFITGLTGIIDSNAADLRDKVYLTEYVMDKFTFLTSQTDRNHLFTKGEVEYILNGRDIPYDPARNCQSVVIANVLAQVWFLRFSIDAIDAFATSKIVNPLARLAWSLSEGVFAASAEMVAMLKGEGVKICPSFKKGPELRYSDHLRILLLMQDEDETLRKIQQLAQVNLRSSAGEEDFRLSSCETAIKAQAEVKVNLLFLPYLSLDKLGLEQFRGGEYTIRREVTIGY